MMSWRLLPARMTASESAMPIGDQVMLEQARPGPVDRRRARVESPPLEDLTIRSVDGVPIAPRPLRDQLDSPRKPPNKLECEYGAWSNDVVVSRKCWNRERCRSQLARRQVGSSGRGNQVWPRCSGSRFPLDFDTLHRHLGCAVRSPVGFSEKRPSID